MARKFKDVSKPMPKSAMKGPIGLHKTLAMGKAYPGIGGAVVGRGKKTK